MNRSTQASREVRGVTLIELLVVVAILALVVAILIPACLGAREKSRQSVCASNLSQLYKATAMYAADNDGFRPMYNIGATTFRIDGREIEWPDQSAQMVQSLQPYAHSPELWFCPDDPLHGKQEGTRGVPKRHPATSYSELFALHTHASGLPTPQELLAPRGNSAEVVLYLDDIMPYMSETPPDTYLYTHSHRFNVVFSDGHLRTMSPHDDNCQGYCH